MKSLAKFDLFMIGWFLFAILFAVSFYVIEYLTGGDYFSWDLRDSIQNFHFGINFLLLSIFVIVWALIKLFSDTQHMINNAFLRLMAAFLAGILAFVALAYLGAGTGVINLSF